MELQGKRIVVTGGAHGIGWALCQRFAAEGAAAIIVADRDGDAARAAAEEIGAAAVQCDVGVESEVAGLAQSAEQRMGGIDLFCANAGIARGGGIELADQQWLDVMQVNFMAHVYSARAVLPAMLKRRRGYLLHTASAAGLLTELGSAPYAVAKHAAVALAEWLAITYRKWGIRVSCLCPQGVQTNMLKGDSPTVRWLREHAISPEDVAESVVQGLKAERFLILPHPEVAKYFVNKATDHDRWLDHMQTLRDEIFGPDDSTPGPTDTPDGDTER